MNRQPELINIPNEYEAQEQVRREEEFMTKRNEEWKALHKSEFRNDLLNLGVLSLLIFVIFLNIVKYFWLASLLTLIVFCSHAIPLFLNRIDDPLYDFKLINYSARSQFYLVTKDKRIVGNSVSDGILYLVLEDIFSGEQSFAEIRHFKIGRKTGIKNIQVDISEGKIYAPVVQY